MKFTIRDLLWLTAVVSLGVALAVKHVQHSKLQDEHRMLTWSHDMLAESLEQALDSRVEDAVASGQPVFVPIYADDADSADAKNP